MTHRLAAPFLAGLAILAMTSAVLAHASLVSSDPPLGGTVTSTPFTLTATFDDELTPNGSSIVIENAAGLAVSNGTVSAADAHILTAQLPALPMGTYSVKWTAVSADDQAVERGTYAFSVGSASASSTPTPTQPPDGGAAGSSNDVLVAVGLAAVLVLVVVAFIFVRGRR